ncbi:hypothetical protein GCM10022377_10220 [Zhihengliuella alba]|uniref:Tail assembly chaperone n=1 Tax=Zhihengliuella alba TaxID=547018 RepID=A0ABP7D0R1_9MICC
MALSVKRAERRVSVCLDGSLVAQYEAVTEQLETKLKEKLIDNRLNDPVAALQREQHRLFEAQREQTVTFVVRGLPRSKWDEFVEAHPPREGVELDKEYGFNTETIFDAILSHDAPASIAEVLDADGALQEFKPADWTEFSKDLTRSQFERFRAAVTNVNAGESAVPFSLTAFKATQDSAGK